MSTATPAPQYALYLQATRLRKQTGKVMRRQWIVFPPLPEQLAQTVESQVFEKFLMFYREQATPENRVKWRFSREDPDLLSQTLPGAVADLMLKNEHFESAHRWTVSPVITAQVTVRELAQLQKDPVTPYAVIRRFEKVAKSVHHIAI